MIGAIAGDIVGSVYEWDNIKTKDFDLFTSGSFFTDETVLTVARADSIMTGRIPWPASPEGLPRPSTKGCLKIFRFGYTGFWMID